MKYPVLALGVTLALAGVGAGTPAFAQSSDQPPSIPANLAARAYGATAGGIRWDRSSDDRGAVRGYEITRNGAVIGVRDTLSYVDQALVAATTYTFGVTAIDNAGQRSATAVTRLTTPASGGATTPTAPAPTLAAVGGLRSSVYSSTAAGIAWTRSSAPVVRYEVSRDGAVVSTTDGTSYIDSSLAGGRSYTYSVVALDVRGNRSAPASTMFDTPAGAGGGGTPSVPPVVIVPTPPETPTGPIKPPSGPGTPVELPARVTSRLQTVFDIANFDQLERVGALAAALDGVEKGRVPGFVKKRFATNTAGTENTTLACPGGGQIDVLKYVEISGLSYNAKACRSGSLTFDGQLSGDALSTPFPLVSAEGLTLRDARDGSIATIRTAGTSRSGNPDEVADRLGYEALFATGLGSNPSAIRLVGGARPFALAADENITDTLAASPAYPFGDSGFVTDFAARLGADTGVTRVSTTEPFAYIDEFGNFASGRLEIAGPGFRYVVDAASGSNDSFRLDVSGNGSTTSYSVPWSDTLRFDPFEPGKVDLGF